MGGWNLETSNKDTFYSERDGFLSPDRPNYDLMDGLNYKLEQGDKNWSYIGVFYRLNYGYKGRYLIETSGRYDGSSKFPVNRCGASSLLLQQHGASRKKSLWRVLVPGSIT